MAQGLTQTRLSLILRTEPIFEVGMSRPYKEIDPIQLNQLTDKYSDKEIGEMLGHSRWTITQARFRFEIKSFYEKTGFKRNVKGGRPQDDDAAVPRPLQRKPCRSGCSLPRLAAGDPARQFAGASG